MPRLGFDAKNIKKVRVAKMNRSWKNVLPKSYQRNTDLANKIERDIQQIKKGSVNDDRCVFKLTFSDNNLNQ